MEKEEKQQIEQTKLLKQKEIETTLAIVKQNSQQLARLLSEWSQYHNVNEYREAQKVNEEK